MKVLVPLTVAALVSSTVPDSDYAAWASGTTYTVGQRVIRVETHRVYERLALGAGTVAPESDQINWLDVGATNRWAMFDDSPSTATTTTSSMSVTLAPGAVNDIVLHGVVGSTARIYAGGSLVRTVSVPAAVVPATSSTVTITGLGIAAGVQVGIELTGSGTVAISMAVLGTFYTLGETMYGVNVGITDFSKASTNAFGVTEIVRRRYSRKLSSSVRVATSAADDTTGAMESLRSRVAWWVFDGAYDTLQCMGYCADWSATINGPAETVYSLTVEGLSNDDAVIYPGAVVGSDAAASAALGVATVVWLYQRTGTSTAPSMPTSSIVYAVDGGAMSGITNSWQTAVPATVGAYLWAITATVFGVGSEIIIPAASWKAAAILAQDGAAGATGAQGPAGASGISTAVVYLYQRAASAPAVPSTTLTYTFASNALTGTLGLWSTSVPAGSNPLYVTAATASSTTASDTIASAEWASPIVLAQDGTAGATGATGATVYLFQRTTGATPALPSAAITYTFATGAASGLTNGWTTSLPTTGGSSRWMTTATALSASGSDTIAAGEWAPVALLAQDGANGTNGTNGAAGQRGTVQLARAITGSAWSDTEAAAALTANGSGSPILGDVVTLFNNSASPKFSQARVRTASTWDVLASYINGSMLVDGTVVAQKIDARGLSIQDAAGNIILAAGSSVAASTLNIPGTVNNTPSTWLNGNVPVGGGNLLTNPSFLGNSITSWTLAAQNLITGEFLAADTWAGQYKLNLSEGAYMHSPGAYVSTAAYLDIASASIPTAPGRWLQAQILAQLHRSGAQLYLAFKDAVGNVLSYGGFAGNSFASLPANGVNSATWIDPANGQTAAQQEFQYQRLWHTFQTPANCTYVQIFVRMFQRTPTVPLPQNSDYYVFLARAMLCEVPANCAVPVAFDWGAGNFRGLQQITPGNVSTFIAAAAIGNAYIGNFISSLNFNGAVDAAGNVTANGTTGWVIGKGGKAVFSDAYLRGSLSAGSFSAYAWPGVGGTGFYLGPEGLLLGSAADGKYFQVTSGGDIYSPGFTVIGGALSITQVNVVSTLNVAGNAITVSTSASNVTPWNGGQVLNLTTGTTQGGVAGVYGSFDIVALTMPDTGGAPTIIQTTINGMPNSADNTAPVKLTRMYLRRDGVLIAETALSYGGAPQALNFRDGSPGSGAHTYTLGIGIFQSNAGHAVPSQYTVIGGQFNNATIIGLATKR